MKELIFKLGGAVVLIGSLLVGWLWMDYQAFLETPLDIPEQEQIWTVEPGSSLSAVAAGLERQGLIDNMRHFVWMARLRGQSANIQAGEYLLGRGITPVQLLEKMVSGKVHHYSLTLVEGWNFSEMMHLINGAATLKHTLTGKSNAAIMQLLGKPDEHPEGRFYPDTYSYPRGLSDVEFLKRAYRAMSERLATEWEQRADGLPLKTPYEALTLASIVEKETGLASERQAIAGVFTRRLQKRMRLQTDPTVIYGLGAAFDGNLRRRDLTQDTPYNTYTRRGLPPTPIAMPGGDAIHAALHPADGDALYFVSRGDGSHHFSATLEEHNRAVIKYQLKGRKRPFSSYSGK